MDSHKTAGPTLAVLVLLCVLGLFFGVRALSSDLPDDPIVKDPEPTCTLRDVPAGGTVFPADVLVSVFNGGTRSGVASSTLGKLVERGFVGGEAGNTQDAGVRFVQVWAEDPTNPAVQLVARQFGPRTRVTSGHPVLGPGVVVVVGDEFKEPGPLVKSVRAESSAQICSPPLDDPLE